MLIWEKAKKSLFPDIDKKGWKAYKTLHFVSSAWMAEMVDARDLKSLGRKAVRVRFPLQAPTFDFTRSGLKNIERVAP